MIYLACRTTASGDGRTMTYWAIDKRTELKIHISSVRVYRLGDVKCVLCEQDLQPKYSTLISSHFAHLPEASFCSLMSKEASESSFHLLSKEYLTKILSIESIANPEQSLGYHRPKPDVLAEYDHLRVAHEVQLSYISTFDLQTRASKLRACDVGQNWWLGRNALNPWNKRVVQSLYGFTSSVLESHDELDIPQLVAEKIIYDGDTPYVAKVDYPIIKPEPLQSARYYKFIGTNGDFSLWKIIDADGDLVRLQNVFNDDRKIWTYLNPKLGESVYGKAIHPTDATISRYFG